MWFVAFRIWVGLIVNQMPIDAQTLITEGACYVCAGTTATQAIELALLARIAGTGGCPLPPTPTLSTDFPDENHIDVTVLGVPAMTPPGTLNLYQSNNEFGPFVLIDTQPSDAAPPQFFNVFSADGLFGRVTITGNGVQYCGEGDYAPFEFAGAHITTEAGNTITTEAGGKLVTE